MTDSEAETTVENKTETDTVAESTDNPVTNIEHESEPAENAVVEEGEPKLEDHPEHKPEEDAEHKPEEDTENKEHKQTEAVNQRLSHDTTHQIQMTYVQDDDVSFQSPVNIFGQQRRELGPVVDISSSSSGEEEEELSDTVSYLAEFGRKEEKEPIDRAACEEEYTEAKEYNLILRRRNGLLNKKVSEYYYKRKIMRVFNDCSLEMFESQIEKYENKIHELHNLKIKNNREREAVDNEIRDMIYLRDDQKEDLFKRFTEMQRREAEVMRGLIDSNTGKVISDKVIEKLLLRQKSKSEVISEIRLAYIKRRDKIKSLEQKIKTLETIGGTLHLMDFEQLRMENQTYSDKIEEREDELMRLRQRYSYAVQANAHIREKINIIEVQIDDIQDRCFSEENNVNHARGQLNKLKLNRDYYRATKDKLKISTGILTYPKLLRDMEKGFSLVEEMHKEIDNLISINKTIRTKLNNIRHTIEKTEQVQIRKSNKKIKFPKLSGNKVFRSRPTISYPTSLSTGLKSQSNKF